MLDRDIVHILDNFSRQEIYELYKDYAQSFEANSNFITYSYFRRIWKRIFNNVSIPKKPRMEVCSIYSFLK
jgi:hypothetical protein